MIHGPDNYSRRSIRLHGYDYSQAGAYFVTICTYQRVCLFGDVVDGEMLLNPYGQAAQRCWEEIPDHFAGVQLDEFVFMPNHMHGILHIAGGRGTACRAPTTTTTTIEQFGRPISGSLPTIIRSFKSASTKGINVLRGTSGRLLWQRNYYEHIVRNENELDDIREYIAGNPAKWPEDAENPKNQPT